MRCTFYENVCSISGTFCKERGEEAEKDCPEAAKFRQIEQTPCPIMVAYGYDGHLSKCDLPLWLRALLFYNTTCVVNDDKSEDQCVVAVHFPKIRGKVHNRNLKPEEIAHLKTEIKTNKLWRTAPTVA